MTAWRPAYLIHGDDHARIAERRARLRRLAEDGGGGAAFEVLDGDDATPAGAAVALSTMTFAIGHRVIAVDGVERWKDADVKRDLVAALATVPPETTIAFFGRDEARATPPKALHAAVAEAGGSVSQERSLRGGELQRWLVRLAAEHRLELGDDAARALLEHVGDRQARLRREVEVLALEHGEGAQIGVHDVESRVARGAERRSWDLADALVGRDRSTALRLLLELREQGERVGGLVNPVATKLREVADAATMLERGDAPQAVRDALGGPPWKVKKAVAAARDADPVTARAAVEELAALESGTRGLDDLSEDTQALRAVVRVAR